MIKQTKKIFGAFYKLLTIKDKLKFQQQRLDICAKCDDRAGIICGKCGCYLKAKTIEESESCPLGKWESQKAV